MHFYRINRLLYFVFFYYSTREIKPNQTDIGRKVKVKTSIHRLSNIPNNNATLNKRDSISSSSSSSSSTFVDSSSNNTNSLNNTSNLNNLNNLHSNSNNNNCNTINNNLNSSNNINDNHNSSTASPLKNNFNMHHHQQQQNHNNHHNQHNLINNGYGKSFHRSQDLGKLSPFENSKIHDQDSGGARNDQHVSPLTK